MNGKTFLTDDIIKILPNEKSDFTAILDTKTVVVKIPGVINYKYSSI